jgi:hypothetical protein
LTEDIVSAEEDALFFQEKGEVVRGMSWCVQGTKGRAAACLEDCLVIECCEATG